MKKTSLGLVSLLAVSALSTHANAQQALTVEDLARVACAQPGMHLWTDVTIRELPTTQSAALGMVRILRKEGYKDPSDCAGKYAASLANQGVRLTGKIQNGFVDVDYSREGFTGPGYIFSHGLGLIQPAQFSPMMPEEYVVTGNRVIVRDQPWMTSRSLGLVNVGDPGVVTGRFGEYWRVNITVVGVFDKEVRPQTNVYVHHEQMVKAAK